MALPAIRHSASVERRVWVVPLAFRNHKSPLQVGVLTFRSGERGVSTKGFIAVPAGVTWRGRYHHWDSYPSGLGRELFRVYSEAFGGDAQRMRSVLTEDHTEWAFAMGDWSQPPHFYDLPDEIGAPRCYCHGGDGVDVWYGPDDTDMYAEFSYIIRDEGLDVLASIDKRWHRLGWLPWTVPFEAAEEIMAQWTFSRRPAGWALEEPAA